MRFEVAANRWRSESLRTANRDSRHLSSHHLPHRPLNGPFAVFHHGGLPENSPLALMGRFLSLMARFPTLMGVSPNAFMSRFPSRKSPGKQPIKSMAQPPSVPLWFREQQRGVENSPEVESYHKTPPKTIWAHPTYDTFSPLCLFTPCHLPWRKQAQTRRIPLPEASKTGFGARSPPPQNRKIRFALRSPLVGKV